MRIRVLLLVVALLHAMIAYHTFAYPPAYLTAGSLWATLAAVVAATSLLTAVAPSRWSTALSGAMLVCTSAGRSLVLVGQAVVDDAPPTYAVGASVWVLISVLAYFVWADHVAAWSALRRHQ